MRINYINDIHLEFGALSENPFGGDVLILAGDITVKNRVDWINEIAKDFKHVIYVLGNHEFYRQYYNETYEKTKKQLVASNVHLLQNESVTLDGITFHGTTLWSDFERGNPLSYIQCGNSLSDFNLIYRNLHGKRFSPQLAHLEHVTAKTFLHQNVKKNDVVVTHHAPTFESIGEDFKKSDLNGGYASDLSELIINLEPFLWFHGHLHNTSDYMVHNTRVLNNPRGYREHKMNSDFDVHKFVEISH